MTGARELLDGKAWVATLPEVTPENSVGSPSIKRLMLKQGELAQIHDSDEPIRYLASIELLPGFIRGNHLHRVKREFIYLLAGEFELVVEDPATRERAEARLRKGDLAFVDVEVAHALRPLTVGLALEYSAARFNAADIIRYPLIS
jgi:hypothetical protein